MGGGRVMPPQGRRRLVVTCAGSWSVTDSDRVTNVEKMTRCLETNPDRTGNVPQVVLPQSRRGTTSPRMGRLGRYSSRGLDAIVVSAFRSLCYNYLPGDEIFILGEARGALTARRLAGMIGRFGLLDRESSVRGLLPEVMARYQRTAPTRLLGDSDAEFRSKRCVEVSIAFLGVFETVGALGIPGRFSGRRQRLHDLQLPTAVQAARQALAIDEPRIAYRPSLWLKQDTSARDPRVKQVWFEGCHSDVTGGYAQTGLSDTTLLWMATEAARSGLIFDPDLLVTYVASGSDAIRHTPIRARKRQQRAPEDAFTGNARRLDPPGAVEVRVASSAVDHAADDTYYRPENLMQWLEGHDPGRDVEEVTAMPLPYWRGDLPGHPSSGMD